jgi:hypothetical protein
MLGPRMKRILILAAFLVSAACSGQNDNSHTTATTIVPPPPRQVLRAEMRPGPQTPARPDASRKFDPKQPLLILNLPNGKTFREGEEVVIDFSLANVNLRGDGGDYRIRYMVDDDDMQWIDRWEQVGLTGWLPGNHTIRVELVRPDGWPYRNGDYNIETREITVVK